MLCDEALNNVISPPISLQPFVSEIRDGFAFSIGFVNLHQNPDCSPDWPEVPEKPWMASVHELPSRANVWLKHYETLGDAVNDALACGLLTADTAEMLRQNCRCVDGKIIIFCGVTKHPELSLASFEHIRIATEGNWQTFKSTLGPMLSALTPVTEAAQ